MKLSVIIPCLNASDTIETQLNALTKQRWSENWEVIVSDNGSSDNTRAIAHSYCHKWRNFRVVDSSGRRGPAHARNVGAHNAVGESLAFCDADDEVGFGWVAAMGQALSKHDFVACRWDIKKLNEPLLQKSRGNPQEKGLQIIWYPPYLPHAGGGGLGIKRSIHEAVGGFDESLGILEDTDYCFKVQNAGVKLEFVPEAVIHVRFRDKSAAVFNQTRLWAKYNVFLYKKYRPSGMKLPQAWQRYIIDWKPILRLFPKIYRRSYRPIFMRLLGWQIGQMQGCIKYLISPTAYPR